MFYPWAAHLPEEIEICAIQLPGRAQRAREAPPRCLRELADDAARAVEVLLDVPSVFFGHSMGALIAFEVARRLRSRRWARPVHLFLSASTAPDLWHLRDSLASLSDEEIVLKLDSWNGMPPELRGNTELLDVIMPALRSDFQLCDSYVYADEPALDIPMTVLGGEDDKEVPFEGLAAWRRQTASRFCVRTFPGGHFYFSTAQDAFFGALNQELRRIINRQRPA